MSQMDLELRQVAYDFMLQGMTLKSATEYLNDQ